MYLSSVRHFTALCISSSALMTWSLAAAARNPRASTVTVSLVPDHFDGTDLGLQSSAVVIPPSRVRPVKLRRSTPANDIASTGQQHSDHGKASSSQSSSLSGLKRSIRSSGASTKNAEDHGKPA
mmetsp:Transcript_96028/g.190342  ORF Transcript_96028/g.190342 Transcript_96028/m.190342 type:complete len:124 (-) Transcript_96028:105-476(-)